MRAHQDELDVHALGASGLLPVPDTLSPASMRRYELPAALRSRVRIPGRQVDRERHEVALQPGFPVQDPANGGSDLADRRRVEFEEVLDLPRPHVPAGHDAPALPPAVRVAEPLEAGAVRPLRYALLDEDRRQLLEAAGPGRGLPVRADAREFNVRKTTRNHASHHSPGGRCRVPGSRQPRDHYQYGLPCAAGLVLGRCKAGHSSPIVSGIRTRLVTRVDPGDKRVRKGAFLDKRVTASSQSIRSSFWAAGSCRQMLNGGFPGQLGSSLSASDRAESIIWLNRW